MTKLVIEPELYYNSFRDYLFVTVGKMIFRENRAQWRKYILSLVKIIHFMYGSIWNELFLIKSVISTAKNKDNFRFQRLKCKFMYLKIQKDQLCV